MHGGCCWFASAWLKDEVHGGCCRFASAWLKDEVYGGGGTFNAMFDLGRVLVAA